MSQNHYDSIVIGAGMGGMSAAAFLTAAGQKVLLLEKSPYLGGRCSDRLREGCRVTTGALMLSYGPNSAIRQGFDAVGAKMEMVDTTHGMRYRLAHGDYELPAGGGGLLGMIEFAMQADSKQANALYREIIAALTGWMPLNTISTRDWFDQHTNNEEVKNLFHGYCSALMGLGLHEIPAGEFFTFLKGSSKGSQFGLAANGNEHLMEDWAAAMERGGCEIRRDIKCRRIVVENNRATAVAIASRDGGEETVRASAIVSNTGPDRTVELAGGESVFEKSYVARLHEHCAEAPIIHISFVTDTPLIEGFKGCLVFGNNKNLIYLEIPSLISPKLSPQGKYLHTAYGAAQDALQFDPKKETEIMLEELEVNFPGFTEQAKILVKAKHQGQSPGMRRWVGYTLPVNTSVAGLFNVGDGCTPSGGIGTEGAAATGRLVAKMIKNQRS